MNATFEKKHIPKSMGQIVHVLNQRVEILGRVLSKQTLLRGPSNPDRYRGNFRV